MKKTIMTVLAVFAMAVLTVGCAITDYDGIPDHKTSAEAKLFGTEISFSGFGADLDGTYAYTVKYDNSVNGAGRVTINSYRNTVVSSFTRDGEVDQDGDDVQGNGGILGGKFLPRFVAVDDGDFTCEFSANVTQGGVPPVSLCITGFQEEIDKDFELHAAFGSWDDLMGQIFSGALTGKFTVNLTGVSINGVTHPVDALSIGASVAATRVSQFTVTRQPSFDSLRDALLANTNHMEPVDFGLVFEGGLTVNLPYNVQLAFNHNALASL